MKELKFTMFKMYARTFVILFRFRYGKKLRFLRFRFRNTVVRY
jgi:hypothetical protein